jgi:hypothetical protein
MIGLLVVVIEIGIRAATEATLAIAHECLAALVGALP